MPRDALPTRLAFRVEVVAAAPVEGTDAMLLTLRTAAGQPLSLRLTRPEAAELMGLILAERAPRPAPAGDG